MERYVVPADNSCMFTAAAYCLDAQHRQELGATFRAAVADAVRADPVAWTEAVLGRPPADYCSYILQPTTWGGGIELSVLAARHKCEVVAVDIRTRRPLVFGEDAGYARRVYLIYDGLHYDALHRREPGGGVTTVFSPTDEQAFREAVAVAEEAHRTRQYTDTANFTLRCLACGAGLVGERDALTHARDTGHTNFSEYDKA
jgi:ubiquitin thioesterase OTU1